MAEWLFEAGIGEDRAVLVADGVILAAAIEVDSSVPAGSVVSAKLAKVLISGRRGIAILPDGAEAMIEPLPRGLTEGATFNAEIVREPIPEAGRPKPARIRASDAPLGLGPGLRARIAATGHPAREGFAGPDRFEAAGWSELLEEAATGNIGFAGGTLRMSVTPAMTLFDVDGTLDPAALAVAGAEAAAHAILRFDIGGSIGVDLPTIPDRAARQAAAEAVDRILPQPFERTAVNGFGFLQIVRRRTRASIPEMLAADPAGAAARALLRRAERSSGSGPRIISAPPAVIARLLPAWISEGERRIGAPIVLRPDAALAIWAGHVQAQHP